MIFSDELNHASIVDGCRLSRATIRVYPHLDLEALREALRNTGDARRILVVTESYFSMDADSPDLAFLSQICGEFGVMLMIDEAHCLGIDGPAGAGLCRAIGIVPDAVVGTFGKAIGTQVRLSAEPKRCAAGYGTRLADLPSLLPLARYLQP